MFSRESDMILPIQTGLRGVLGTGISLICGTEFHVDERIVDLIAIPIDPACVIRLRCLGRTLARLKTPQLDVLSFFAVDHNVSIQRLSRDTYVSPDQLKRACLDSFMDLGLIERRTRYSYAATSWAALLPASVVAIEAKLALWGAVLRQARFNQRFATQSFVALDKDCLPDASCFSDCETVGIGVLAIDANGPVTEILPARRTTAASRERAFHLLRVAKELAGGSSRWRLLNSTWTELA